MVVIVVVVVVVGGGGGGGGAAVMDNRSFGSLAPPDKQFFVRKWRSNLAAFDIDYLRRSSSIPT